MWLAVAALLMCLPPAYALRETGPQSLELVIWDTWTHATCSACPSFETCSPYSIREHLEWHLEAGGWTGEMSLKFFCLKCYQTPAGDWYWAYDASHEVPFREVDLQDVLRNADVGTFISRLLWGFPCEDVPPPPSPPAALDYASRDLFL